MGMLQLMVGMQTLWFLMALGGSLSAYKKFLPEGNIRAAKMALWAACIGDVMLCVIYAVSIVLMGVSLISIIMLALWGYMAYRDISHLAAIS